MVAQVVQPPPIPRRTMSLEFKQYAIVDDNTLMSEVLRVTEGSQLSGCCASDLVCLSIHPSTLPPIWSPVRGGVGWGGVTLIS